MGHALIVKCLTSKNNFTNKNLMSSFQKRGYSTQVFEITQTAVRNNVMLWHGEELKKPDIIIFSHPIFYPKGSIRPETGIQTSIDFLKSLDAVCINNIDEHLNVADKEYTTKRLQAANIKMVKTEIINIENFPYYGSKDKITLPKDLTVSVDRLGGYPIVFKNITGMLGMEVFVANNFEELTTLIKTKLKHSRFILQEYQKSAEAFMLDARVVGEDVFTRILMSSPYNTTESKSIIKMRAHILPCYVSDSIRDLVISANKTLGLDVTRPELFLDKDGVKLCEVNSLGAIVGNEQVNNVNVCDLIVDLAIKKLKARK